MKQAFRELHPSMKDDDGEMKKKAMIKMIINYERDIQEYVDSWSDYNK